MKNEMVDLFQSIEHEDRLSAVREQLDRCFSLALSDQYPPIVQGLSKHNPIDWFTTQSIFAIHKPEHTHAERRIMEAYAHDLRLYLINMLETAPRATDVHHRDWSVTWEVH